MKKDKNHKQNDIKIFNDFSLEEDKLLVESAKIASSKAIRSSTALGISIKIIKDYKIILVNPDKSEQVLSTITKSKIDTSFLKKGMILERK